MTCYEKETIRKQLPHEVFRFVFDALIVPVDWLPLSQDEEKELGKRALQRAHWINWETYTTTRKSFLETADNLLMPYKDRISYGDLYDLKLRMYTAFMESRISYFEWVEQQEHAELPPIEPGEHDFRNTEMAAVFAHLPPQPETAAWLRTINIDWTYDRLNMVTWFSGQLSLGSGKFSRSRPNHSARVTYERLLNPYSLLWIAAALGEDKDLVIRTAHEMAEYDTYRAKCGIIRRNIPWKHIYELALPLAEVEISKKIRWAG